MHFILNAISLEKIELPVDKQKVDNI
jgi:hypothetical protein